MSRRNIFTSEEKSFLRNLVVKHQGVVESKKVDSATIARKKAAWDKITTQFNAIPTHSQRNTAQLRKLWENIKSRRKAELTQEKRERMRTGGGTYHSVIAEDTEIVAIELEGALDSDTLAGSTEYILVGDQFIPLAHGPDNDPDEPSLEVDKASHSLAGPSSAVDWPPPAPRTPDSTLPGPSFCPTSLAGPSKGPSPEAVHQAGREVINNEATSLTSPSHRQRCHQKTRSEAESRIRRNQVLIKHDTELHRVRLEEAHFRREEARKRVEEADLRMEEARRRVAEADLRMEEARKRVAEADLQLEEAQLRIEETQLRMKEIHKKVAEADLRMEEIKIRLQREKVLLRSTQAKFGEDA